MITDGKLKEGFEEIKKEIATTIPLLQKSIADNDWEQAAAYGNRLMITTIGGMMVNEFINSDC